MTTRANLFARQELIRLSAARAAEPDTATRHKCFLVSAYDLMCRSAYDLMCRSVLGESLLFSP